MRQWMGILLIIASMAAWQGCGNTVHPGQRGLRWYPLTEGLTTETLKSGFYWRAPWNDIFIYDVRLQSYTETVDALSSDDLLVQLKTAIIMRPIIDEVYFLAQEIGPDFYPRVVKPELLAAVRSVVSNYPMVSVPEKSAEIASKVQAVVVEKLKGRHLEVHSVALADIELAKIVLEAVERKQAKEQEKEQKEFELVIAEKDAEIARRRARGEGDAVRIRSEGEAEGTKIRAMGQARAQETITKTLTPEYLRYKLYDSPNAKMVLVPDNLQVPILLNPNDGRGTGGLGTTMHAEEPLTGVGR
ncbi:prohibitin family protein [Nitrospira defluvii]|uniref:Membrane protease n=1 Tax=Nitrospira defluvii TaxID=330214 RepID=A0ABN7LGM9_9BACT|nr:prohibitin family protein [Nitrospira defluvii]CAE6749361.1 Membrane protease [Nitrospira defluvii]